MWIFGTWVKLHKGDIIIAKWSVFGFYSDSSIYRTMKIMGEMTMCLAVFMHFRLFIAAY